VITSEYIEWNPYSTYFAEQENSYEHNSEIRAISSINVEYDYYSDTIMRKISTTHTVTKQLFVDGNQLASKWAIGKNVAEMTVKATTQLFIRSALHPIDRRFKTKNTTLRYNHLKCRFTSDTFFANKPSLLNHTCAQLFISDFGYGKFCPMKLKSEAGYALQELIQGVGIPEQIHTDGAREMTMGSWRQTCRDAGIRTSQTEKNSPWQNSTEVEIRELKRHVRRLMGRMNTPHKLWDFCCQYVTELRNRLARPLPQLHGRTSYEILTGNTPDISEFLEFEWYQPIWYLEPSAFPNQNKLLARWIGIAHRVGQAMCYWILPSTGMPIARTTIQAISQEELSKDEMKRQLSEYDDTIRTKLDAYQDELAHVQMYREDEDMDDDLDDALNDPEQKAPEVDDIEADAYDELLLTEPLLLRDGQLTRVTIIGRKRDQNDNPVGVYHHNPLLNTRIYLAQFPDGHVAEFSVNMISEAIYSQINDDGAEELLFTDIIGHTRDSTALTRQ
jgi:hypothetical protein